MKRLLVAAIAVGCMGAAALTAHARDPKPVRASVKPMEASRDEPAIRSSAALVLDQSANQLLYAKNVDAVVPVASITKLMTAMVSLDADAPLDEQIKITSADLDEIKHTRSRLRLGTVLARGELLRVALMASENRAASALARSYPGGRPAFVAAMNLKAAELGMTDTHFVDGTGLSSANVSTARDLSRMVMAAYRYPLIRDFTTSSNYAVTLKNGQQLHYSNSNRLVSNEQWDIRLSKTGYIAEAGRCLVMQSRIAARDVVIVLLDSWGRNTRLGDANRIRKWMETRFARAPES